MWVFYILFIALTVMNATTVTAADVESLPSGAYPRRQIAQVCFKDLQTFNDKLARERFGVLAPGDYDTSAPFGYYLSSMEATPRQKIRSLRDAAFVFALEGDEKSCQMVLASMHKVYEDYQKLAGSKAHDLKARAAWRRVHLVRAQPVTEMNRLMRADLVIGATIRNVKDEKLGEIEDIVLEPESRTITYILASHGGFMGFGKKWIAIRWSDLRATEDHEIYVLDVSPDVFEAAPTVERRNFAQTADQGWRQNLDRYWDEALQR